MLNGYTLLFLLIFMCLTSCKNDHGTFLTNVKSITDEIGLRDSTLVEVPFSLMNPLIADSSKHYFFVENEAGTVDFQRYDFSSKSWHSVPSLFQLPFLGGPLGTGRIIYQRSLWKDSARHLLLSKNISKGMVVAVQPLAVIEINSTPSEYIYIMVPDNPTYRQQDCNHFDDWFTYCNDQRFFIQYWIEQQYRPRYIQRLQWKPFSYSKQM